MLKCFKESPIGLLVLIVGILGVVALTVINMPLFLAVQEAISIYGNK